MRAEEDEAFGSAPILFRPSFLQMRDSAIIAEMKFGADNLAERKQAAVDRHKLFAARLRSRRIDTIRAFGVDERNNAEGRARMTRRWRDGDWGSSKDLDPVAFSRNSSKRWIGETSIRES